MRESSVNKPFLTPGIAAALLVASMLTAPIVVAADEWPARPVRLILPVPPGGLADITSRLIQNPLTAILGQQLVIENKPGGAGSIATATVARAKPDGYTFGLVYTSHAANPSMMRLPYNSERDLTPIAFFWRAPLAISVHKSTPYGRLSDLITQAKSQPNSISLATAGVGQATHFAAVIFQNRAGIALNHVPYKGGGPAVQDVVAGHVPVLVSGIGNAKQHVDTGALRMLALTSTTRSQLVSNVPTLVELGFPEFQVQEWYGVVGPAGLPDSIVRKMNQAFDDALKRPEVAAELAKLDVYTQAMTPAEFKAYVAGETKRLEAVITANNIKAEEQR